MLPSYLKQSAWIAFFGVTAFSCVVNVLGFAGPLFMLEIYDRAIPSGSIETLIGLSILVLGLYVFSGFLDIARTRVMARMAALVDARISEKVIRAIAGAPLKTRINGDILKPVSEADQIRSFIGGSGFVALFDLPWLPAYLFACFFLHPTIGWLATGSMIVLIALTVFTDLTTRSKTRAIVNATSERNGFAEAVNRNAEAVSAMGIIPFVESRWQGIHENLTGLQRRSSDVVQAVSVISKTIRQAIQSGALAIGAFLVIQGELSGGAIIAGSIVVARTLQPIEMFIGNWRRMYGAWQAWKRLNSLFQVFPDESKTTNLPAPYRDLKVSNLFALPPGERARMTVLNVNFAVPAGSVVGVLGPSASGKSSLVRALTGVWDIAKGKVELDGASIDQWSVAERGRHIGYMPQSSDLFPGSIGQNIARLNPNATDEQIIDAARSAGVHDMIVALPDGYETKVGDGGINLSAGQRQRIALARALFGGLCCHIVFLYGRAAQLDGPQESTN